MPNIINLARNPWLGRGEGVMGPVEELTIINLLNGQGLTLPFKCLNLYQKISVVLTPRQTSFLSYPPTRPMDGGSHGDP